MHNTIIRGINAVYHQAPHVKPADHKAFLNFTSTMIQYTRIHHDGEENMFFPAIEQMTGVKGVGTSALNIENVSLLCGGHRSTHARTGPGN